MSTAPEDESPIVAALPPNTDYITYLTILEYQLKPSNLAVLNEVLGRDDGTLAKEIGWDLLRLVLPMLVEVPTDARNCLELIAKLGNPREVVVRIAEELEHLGQDDDGEYESEEDEDEQNLPTFAGEAPRVHLGKMSLDGMPEAERPDSLKPPESQSPGQHPQKTNQTVFSALLSMLSIVHSRIKTQYPSRFLATSLPAALSAYRRMPITTNSTEAFLTCLGGLAGRQGPPLPSRISTSETRPQAVQASLPDPEAPQEAQAGTNIASQHEKDIIRRLLQAVALEVLEEYFTSMQGEDVPSLMWTKRLRESAEARRNVPGRPTATELFNKPPLDSRDALVRRFTSLLQTLDFDLATAIAALTTSKTENDAAPVVESEENDKEPSEFPSDPSQIPFPTAGLILAFAAYQSTTDRANVAVPLDSTTRLFDVVTPLSETPTIPVPAVQDALNSIALRSINSHPATAGSISELSDSAYIRLMSIITQTFTISPDPQSRDDAHFLATKLLHLQPSSALRLAIIKQTIRAETSDHTISQHPILLATPLTDGALKAVAINWLKDDILTSLTTAPDDTAARTSKHQPLPPSIIHTDTDLNHLLFPSNPLQQPPTTPSDQATTTILLTLPHYTALLNFCSVFLQRLSQTAQYHETLSSLTTSCKSLSPSMRAWAAYLVGELQAALSSSDGAETTAPAESLKASSGDIYAFEDAEARLREALAVA